MDYETPRGTEGDTNGPASGPVNGPVNGSAPNTSGLVPEIAALAAAAAVSGATPLIPGPDNVVVLPAGVSLDDITVQGRDLVIRLDNGQVYIIPDGAIYVPQIVIDNVAVPPMNLAALLNGTDGEDLNPVAGPNRSSGGNFADPVNPIGPAFNLGDLLPYTELFFPEPQQREIIPFVNQTPTTIIITPNNPAGATEASATVNEAGLPARGSEPPGSDSASNSETTTGTIAFTSPDGLASITLNGVAITAVGQTFVTPRGVLTITSIAPGNYGYSYNLTDNTDANVNPMDIFAVVVTDTDGDTASANLTISIIDDVPTARNDTDTVAAGTYGPETGNVITGAGTASGSAGADTQGADGATLTGIRVGNAGAFLAPGGTLTGTYGTLTLLANGNYTYTRNAGTPGGVSDTFSYQLTDGDGDTSTATLTINIADAIPQTATNATVLLDDDALAGGNPGGVGDDVNAANTSGTLGASGGDGPLVWSLSTSGAPSGFTYVANGTGIDVLQGSTIVLRVTLNTATGAYTVTQLAPINHVAGNDENNAGFTLSYQVTDQDGDAATGNLSISVDDDTPTVSVQLDNEFALLIVDETNLGTATTQNYSALFTNSYGADGAGSIGYSLGAVSGPSGLVDTLSGQNVVLTLNAGVVEGRTASSGLLVFTVSVNSSGDVTLTQFRAVVHTPNFGPNDITSVIADHVTLTQTITDKDGDSASATANIGGFLGFVDDAPTAANDTDTIASGQYGPATGNVITDASPGDAGDSDTGADRLGNDGGAVSAITGFGGAGTVGGTTTGQYGVLTLNADGSYSYTRNAGTAGGVNDVFTYTITDGDGDTATATLTITIADALPVTGPNAAGNSDDDAQPGGNPGGTGDDPDSVNLTGTLTGSGGDGPLTWSISSVGIGGLSGLSANFVNSGLVIISQFGTPIVQFTINTATGAYTVTQLAPIQHAAGGDENNSPWSFNYRVTDQDGDFASGTLSVSFDDDTPVAVNDTDTVAAGTYGPETGNVVTGAGTTSGAAGADSIGADGAAAGGPVTAISGTAAGTVGGTTAGTYGSLTMNADGSYSYVRNAGTPGGVNDVFTYTITDKDGDSTTATLTISIADALPLTGTNSEVQLDDDALAGGNAGGIGDDPNAVNTTGTLAASGGDGPLVWAYQTTGAPAGFTYVANGTGIDVFQGATKVLVLTLNTATGAYNVSQVAPIVHAAGSDENNQAFTINYSVTDQDGDTASGTLSINVDDDTPVTTTAASSGTVDEDGLAGGNPGGTGDVAGTATTASGSVAGLFSIGADGLGSYSLAASTAALTAQGLKSDGVALTYAVAGNVLTASAGSTTVFTLTLNATTGAWTFNLLAHLDHAPGGDENDITIQLGGMIVATDKDGDSVTAGGAALTIVVDDDTPVAANDTDTVAAGTYGPETGNVLTGAGTTSGAAGADSIGADGPAAGGAVTAVTGAAAGTIGGTTAGTYGSLTLNADGSYSYVRNAGTPGGVSDVFTYTITDRDGDTTTATLTITIADALPVTGANAAGNSDDDAQPGGNPGGTGDDPDSVNLTGTLTGSGGDGPLTWSISSIGVGGLTGLSANFVNSGLVIISQFGTPIVQFSINTATGAYTVTQLAPIVHAAGGDENNSPWSFNYRVTDQDGDFASGTLSVSFDDDTPVAHSDTDTVAAGTYGPETGNVFTGAGTTSGAAGADSIGADGSAASGPVTAIVGTAAGTIGGATAGTYGSLTMNADGSYSYVRNAGTPGGVNDVFTYTITDKDGDSTTATLTITIADAQPLTGTNATVQLDDDALAGGNPGGTGDDPNAVNTTGTLAASGGDGPLTWALGTGGAPAGFSYVANGTGIDVFQGATKVLAITLNTANGGYTITQVAPIVHDAGSDENNQAFSLSYTVTDQDGDSASGTLNIDIDDDTPVANSDTDTVAAGTYGPETGNVVTGAGTTSGAAGADSFGADGPAANPVTAISGSGGAGTIGGTTTGTYGSLTMNADGSYSYLRNAGTPGGVSDTFTYTISDKDGDTSTATLTINIADAAPITGANAAGNSDDDAQPGGNPGGIGDGPDSVNLTGTLSGSGGDGPLAWSIVSVGIGGLSGLSASFVNAGLVIVSQFGTPIVQMSINTATGAYTVTQLAPIQHAAGGDENNSPWTFGYRVTDQDGDFASGSLSITFNDDTPVAVNDTDTVASGSNAPIAGNVLTGVGSDGNPAGADSLGADGPKVGGAVTAVTGVGAGTIGGNTTGTYGVLALNADGSYTYTRNSGSPGNVNDVFTYTITDKDGDNATATLTISILDAAPVTTPNATVLLDDDALAGGNPGGTGDDADTANTTGTLSGSGGDGALTWAYQTTGAPAGFTYQASGSSILVKQGATTVLTITLNPANGAYTVTQNAPILHAAGSDENNQPFTINYSVTDADGDSAAGTLSINVDDDTPVVTTNMVSGTVDEDGLAGGNPGGTGDVAGAATSATGSVAGLFSIGADGLQSYSLAANTATLTAQGLTSGGVALTYGVVGNVLTATAGATQVFTLTLTSGGTWTFNLLAKLDHPAGGNENDITIQLGGMVIATDKDGDSVTATAANFTVVVDDDTPIATVNTVSGTVDEDGLAGGNPGGTGDVAGVATSATGSVASLFSAGADSPLTYSLASATAALTAQGLTSGGTALTYAVVGNTLTASAGVSTVFTLALTSGGNWTFTLLAKLDHPAGGNENDITIQLGSMIVATDTDGDPVTATAANFTIVVDDDTPIANNDTDTVASGTYGPETGNVFTGTGTTSGAGGADSIGADGAAVGGPVTAITGTAAGTIGGATAGTYGTLTMNADGSYSYVRSAGTPGGVNDVFTYTITDRDGDSTTATLTISIADAAPITAANAQVLLDDDALAGGIAGGTGDTVDAQNTTGTLAASGGDGPLVWAYQTTGAPAGFTYTANGTGIDVFQGATKVLVLTLNTATGGYNVSQVAAIKHATGSNENNQAFTINYTATDQDGDAAAGTLSISVNDDSPIAVVPTAISLTNAAGAPVLASLDANLLNNYGADGGAPRFAPSLNGANSGMTSGLTPILYTVSADGLTLTGKAGATTIFTVTLLPGTNQYSVDMDGTVDSLTTLTFDAGTYNFLGGNTAWVGFVPLGQDTTGGAINDNSKDLLVTPSVGGLPSSTINGSSVALGVGSGNNVDAGEMVRIDFVIDLTGNTAGSGGYGVAGNRDHVFDSHYVTNGASALLTASAGSVVKVTAKDDPDGNNVVGDGVIDPITKIVIAYNSVASSFIIPTVVPTNYVVNGITFTVTLNADGSVNVGNAQGTSGAGAIGTQIAAYTANGYSSLEFAHVSGDAFKLGNFGAVVQNTNPVNFTLPVEVIDGDGDVSAAANLAITLTAPVVPPLVLDLNHNGVEFLAAAAGVAFDYNGDGHPETTAWAAASDGLLAIDLNGNGKIDNGSELVFGGNGQTDLQGLAAQYDTNHDGQLTSADADFGKFGVWQDADSDGVTDAGEFRSLTEAGITSISLTSDGQGYSAAGGDVTVHGETTFTMADGTTGTLADASFAYVAGMASDGGSAQAMDSLLAQSGGAADTLANQDLPVLAAAFEDTAGSHLVDAIVDHFAANDGGPGNWVVPANDFALQGLLDSAVGDGANQSAFGFNMAHALQMNEHADLAQA